MGMYFIRTDRSSIPPAQKEAALDAVYQQAKELNPQDPGYSAALAEIVDTVVTSQSKTYRWSTDDARIFRAELADLSASKLSLLLTQRDQLKARQAHTVLQDSKDILREEDLIFRGFTRVAKTDAQVPRPQMRGVIRGLGRLAATLGAPRAFDGWYAREATETVEGERANNIGAYGKRARPFMMPFNEIRTLTLTDVENPLLLKVMSDNRRGVFDALDAMTAALPKTDGDEGSDDKTFLVPSPVLNRFNLLGNELSGFREYVDRLQDAPADRFGEVREVLTHNHAKFVDSSYAAMSELRVPFNELEPVVQRRNVPNLLGALYGMTQANRLVGDVLDNGILLSDGAPTEAGNDLQLHLVSSASHAMSMTFADANATFAGAVADEIGLLLAHHNGAQEQVSNIHDIVEKACVEAGNEFGVGGKGPKRAPEIALKHVGELMAAMRPEDKTTPKEWTQRAQGVLQNVRAEDLAQICQETFGIGDVPKGRALKKALEAEIDSNDYFYSRIGEIKPRSKTDKALSEDDRALLRNMLYMANATWKTGQVHRAISEGDLSRVNPSERERVFNAYDLTVTAAGSDLKSFFVVAKDLLVLKG